MKTLWNRVKAYFLHVQCTCWPKRVKSEKCLRLCAYMWPDLCEGVQSRKFPGIAEWEAKNNYCKPFLLFLIRQQILPINPFLPCTSTDRLQHWNTNRWSTGVPLYGNRPWQGDRSSPMTLCPQKVMKLASYTVLQRFLRGPNPVWIKNQQKSRLQYRSQG